MLVHKDSFKRFRGFSAGGSTSKEDGAAIIPGSCAWPFVMLGRFEGDKDRPLSLSKMVGRVRSGRKSLIPRGFNGNLVMSPQSGLNKLGLITLLSMPYHSNACCSGNHNYNKPVKASVTLVYYGKYRVHEKFRLTKISPTPDTFVLQKYLVE